MTDDREHRSETLSLICDAVFSPNDEAETGKGWYVHNYHTNKTSQLFATKDEAKKASETGTLIYD